MECIIHCDGNVDAVLLLALTQAGQGPIHRTDNASTCVVVYWVSSAFRGICSVADSRARIWDFKPSILSVVSPCASSRRRASISFCRFNNGGGGAEKEL